MSRFRTAEPLPLPIARVPARAGDSCAQMLSDQVAHEHSRRASETGARPPEAHARTGAADRARHRRHHRRRHLLDGRHGGGRRRRSTSAPGPALVISFVLTAIACGFAALCYAEFAAMVPISGSAYTYAYATLGELVAWIIGWDLIIEYAVGNVAVAMSWSGYFQELLPGSGCDMARRGWAPTTARPLQAAQPVAAAARPAAIRLTLAGRCARRAEAWSQRAAPASACPSSSTCRRSSSSRSSPGCWCVGIKESARFNSAMVVLKLVDHRVLHLRRRVLRQARELDAVRAQRLRAASRAPRPSSSSPTSASTPCRRRPRRRKNPQRDMPIGIIASLVDLHGDLHPGGARADRHGAVEAAGHGRAAGHGVLGAGACTGPRASWRSARCSPRPPCCSSSSSASRASSSRWRATACCRPGRPRSTRGTARRTSPRSSPASFVAVFAGVSNIDEVVELTNIGTLFAFILVALGIIVLRGARPGSAAAVPHAVRAARAAGLAILMCAIPDAPAAA